MLSPLRQPRFRARGARPTSRPVPSRPRFTPAPVELRRRAPTADATPEVAPPPRLKAVRRLAATLLVAALAVAVATSTQRTAVFKGGAAQVQIAVADELAALREAWQRHLALGAVIEAHANLREEHGRLALEVMHLREVAREHARLADLVDMAHATGLEGVGARVVARPTSGRHTLRVDAGVERGIAVGQAVVSAAGVVGQVVDVGQGWADVLAVTDPMHAVPAVIAEGTVHGTARGDRRALALDHVIGGTDVRVGAPVLTSGEGGVFPRGLPLGTVTAVSLDDGPFLAIEVAPAARPGTLAEVLVLAGPPGELARR